MGRVYCLVTLAALQMSGKNKRERPEHVFEEKNQFDHFWVLVSFKITCSKINPRFNGFKKVEKKLKSNNFQKKITPIDHSEEAEKVNLFQIFIKTSIQTELQWHISTSFPSYTIFCSLN